MNLRLTSVRMLPAHSLQGRKEVKRRTGQPELFLLMHAVLGMVLQQIPTLSTLHVYVVLTIGVYWATTRSRIFAAYVTAYVVGAEVLWRMTGASFFWEGGKYTVVLILALSLFREKGKKPIPVTVLFYFLLLLPSVILTLDALGISAAREAISFNLSGPLALFVSAWFFANLRVNSRQLTGILISLVAPILSIATYSLLSTLRAVEIRWANDSLFQTSGGFGPNQVSTIMGLGLVTIVIILLIGYGGRMSRLILSAVAIVLLIQGLLTFSRGGMLAAVITLVVVVIHMVRARELRIRLLILSVVSVPIILFVVLPALNEFTQGYLETRFTDMNLTNRDVFLLGELQLFQSNPFAGVGPGVGNTIRGGASHTEMTRLLAEHGLLGAISLALLLFMIARRYAASGNSAMKGLRLGWMMWSLIVMTNAAMRLAAVSFTYGLAFVHFELDDTAN